MRVNLRNFMLASCLQGETQARPVLRSLVRQGYARRRRRDCLPAALHEAV